MNIEIKNVLSEIEYVEFIGNISDDISNITSLDAKQFPEKSLLWCNDKNLHKLTNLDNCTIIVSEQAKKLNLKKNCNYIVVENPRRAFQKILTVFFRKVIPPKISVTATIHKTTQIGINVFIGENVVIEENCSIGDNCFINHNTVILSDTIIGNNVIIGSNCTVGGAGFGYEKNEIGEFELIPHIGNVHLYDNVEIGNNTCIDRAVLGSTILKKNVKVDNLVHIAHGVIVGENSVVIANSMIGGSTVIGDNVWVSPSASLLNKIVIENNSLIGMSANVIKNVAEYEVVAGNPAKVIKLISHETK